ncbi:MAG: hypothetical protein U1E99_03980 [Agitococcus sp.]
MFKAGWSKREILVKAQGYAMMGYGMWHNRAWGQQTPLFARAIWLADEQGYTLYMKNLSKPTYLGCFLIFLR